MLYSELSVRRCTLINASPDKVWEHFQSRDAMEPWFSIGHTLDKYVPGPNGYISLHVELDSGEHAFGGKISRWDPGKRLTIANNWFEEEMAWPVELPISFLLKKFEGGTLVELLHHGFELLGKEASAQHEMYEAGWNNQHLMALKKLAESS